MNTDTLKRAAAFLGPRARMAAEMRAYLLEKGYADADVEEVVSYLKERKLINDKTTTQTFIERKSGKRAMGKEKLRAELERLGAPEETIEESLGKLNETKRALNALRAKFTPGAERAKAGRFLYGRGFDEEAVEAALDAFCGSIPE